VEPRFFATPDEFRAWLAEHHETAGELLVGFHKKGSGRPSMTWPESVDQALCFGWIDGIRRRIDDDAYSIRFTPRKRTSTWSTVNVRRMGELIEAGLVAPMGLAAFEARREDRSGIYGHERATPAELEADQQRRLEADAEAWAWFSAQAPSYRRTAIHWVVSAKRPETRERRLAALIEDSRAGVKVKPLRWGAGSP
jgi:uncharacterized protein YdeI (YjbR/CyaY-like superfamily)